MYSFTYLLVGIEPKTFDKKQTSYLLGYEAYYIRATSVAQRLTMLVLDEEDPGSIPDRSYFAWMNFSDLVLVRVFCVVPQILLFCSS